MVAGVNANRELIRSFDTSFCVNLLILAHEHDVHIISTEN